MRSAASSDRHAPSRRASACGCPPPDRRTRRRERGRPASPRGRAGERPPRRRRASSAGTLLAAEPLKQGLPWILKRLAPKALGDDGALGDGGLGRDRPRSGLPLPLGADRRVHLLAVRLVRHRRATTAPLSSLLP